LNLSRTFPRASLGLPILFQFKTAGDPYPTNMLNAFNSQELRLASPVIIKPWGISEHEAIPMLLSLNTPLLEQQLKDKGAKLLLRQKGAADVEVAPPGREAIQRLLEFSGQLWNTQVQQL
jgi:CRISPR/Cas system CMR-associated protein Cmr1 (group 7 of RAMP superfamily)